jgi:hypothetical protein
MAKSQRRQVVGMNMYVCVCVCVKEEYSGNNMEVIGELPRVLNPSVKKLSLAGTRLTVCVLSAILILAVGVPDLL